ncbi:uncharacterized protein EDB91DRAFT_1256108 [Suillus paluster]|uniref:uncharacterized protein n=1 Tax=Suillus paluster TaxID=48578 RepID=UPI001B85BC37|nr:uncharacterized protein EDB91DRAFT_1256108 [Suillus paluster]KAG1722379.1 hypothetical protein EDB91DRAFT_1256108 [Suillus paluster]
MQTQLLVVLYWEALVHHANPSHESQMRQLNDWLSILRSLSTSEVQRIIMHETATAHSSVMSPSLSINHPHAAAAMLSHRVSLTGTDLANRLESPNTSFLSPSHLVEHSHPQYTSPPPTPPLSFPTYKLRATAVRPGLLHNLTASHPVALIHSFAPRSLEYQQTLKIENPWPEKLMYTLVLPHRAWAAGDTLTALCKFIPLAKGVRVLSILTNLNETVKIRSRGSNFTRTIVTSRHEVSHGKLKLISESWDGIRQSIGPGASLHSSIPHSPGFEPDLTLRQVPTPFLLPTLPPPHIHTTNTHTSDLIYPLSLTLPPTLPPSHALNPIHISHRICWSILMSNLDGHTSGLRCSLPITILDGRLLSEARAGDGESVSGGAGIFGEEGDEEEGERLPSYTTHVRDRVANAFLPAGSTMRIANPYVSSTPHIPLTQGLSTSFLPRSGASSPPHLHVHHAHTLPHDVPDWVNSELLSRRLRSPHSNSDPTTSQVPSRLVSHALSPEHRDCGHAHAHGTMGPPATVSVPISIPETHRPTLAPISLSPADPHRPPIIPVSNPEIYTHSPPASRTRGLLLSIAMKPLHSGWFSRRSGSHSSLVGMGGHGHGLGMTSVSPGAGSGAGGGHSRSFGNLVSPLQPLEYPAHRRGHSRHTTFSIGGNASRAKTPYFTGTHSPHSPQTPPAEIAESAICGRGFTEVGSVSHSHGGRSGEDFNGDGSIVKGSVGASVSVEGNTSGLLDGDPNANAAPDYRVTSQGFIGGVPLLSSYRVMTRLLGVGVGGRGGGLG